MITRVWLLYRIEISKAIRRRQAYLGPVLLVAAVVFSTLVHPIAQDDVADYGFIAYVTPLSLGFLGASLDMAVGTAARRISQS